MALTQAAPVRLAPAGGAPLRRRRRCAAPLAVPALRTRAALAPPGGIVLVAGASGGVGQLAVASLLARGYNVRALVRSAERAASLFGDTSQAQASGALRIIACDLRDAAALAASGAAAGVDAVVCATGTTAFPSKRWDNGNGPEATDSVAVGNLVAVAREGSPKLARFVLVSSIGVTRTDRLPYLLLNLFGVLKFKAQGEARSACAAAMRALRGLRLRAWLRCSRDACALTRAPRTRGSRGRRRRCARPGCRGRCCVPGG
jgi:NAD(P)-dependent dehydrogenase (short-subunit alcohol dehydrogenase family)